MVIPEPAGIARLRAELAQLEAAMRSIRAAISSIESVHEACADDRMREDMREALEGLDLALDLVQSNVTDKLS